MIIEIPYDNAQIVKSQHDSMKAWHQDMAKSHSTAAGWHQTQSDLLSKAINNVPLDPTTVNAPHLDSDKENVDDTLGQPPVAIPNATNVPLDPMKKSDLIEILKDHIKEIGVSRVVPGVIFTEPLSV